MRKASAPMLFLIGLLVVAVIGGVTFGIASIAGIGDDDDEGVAAGPGGGDGSTSSTVGGPALAASQVAVTGTATDVSVIGAVIESLIVGEVTTPSAGLGAGATFEGVLVDGEESTIVWDAGRPLVFAPSTPLRLHPAPVNITAGPASIDIAFPNESVHRLEPGTYEIDAPVAVSAGGLADAVDSVTFTATQDTTVSFTGDAAATILPLAMTVRGPGQVGITGALTVRHPDDSTEPAEQIGLPQGSFEITFSPAADATGYDLSNVLLEGAVVVT